MVIAAEVQDAVDRSLGEVGGVLGADHDVAQLARTGDRAGTVDWKREHVGGPVAIAVLAVELADPLRADELDREVTVLHPGRAQRRLDRRAKLHRDIGEVRGQSDFARSENAS